MSLSKYLNLDEKNLNNLLSGTTTKKKNKTTDTNCISCESDDIIFNDNTSTNICNNCGTVNDKILNNVPIFSKDDNSSNYGCPSNFFCPKSSLGTKMKLKRRGYNRISNINKQGQVPYSEKEITNTIRIIEKKCKKQKIRMPIIKRAQLLYDKIKKFKYSSGKRKGKHMIMRCINRQSIIAACVYYACKLENEPRSPKEIADIWGIDIKFINRGYRKILDFINMETLNKNFKSSKSSDFVTRYSKKLNIEDKYIDIITNISNNIHKLDIVSTHEPNSIAAGCILLVAKMYQLTDITKKKISAVFQISDVTISKTYRRIYNYHQIITNNKLVDLICIKSKKYSGLNYNVNINKTNLIVNKELLTTSSDITTTESLSKDCSNHP